MTARADSVDAASAFDTKARKQSTVIMRRFLRHRMAMASLVVFLLLAVFGFILPMFWKYNYADTSSAPYLPISGDHPLGTDRDGSDMLAMLMRGTQYSIQIAFVVAILATIIGVVLGSLAGYLKGWVDSVIMRLTDLFLLFPYVAVAAILIHKFVGAWYIVSLVLVLFAWMQTARINRGEALSLSEREFVEAAKAAGAGPWAIIFKHLVPNMIGTITVNATLSVAQAILAEAALSFIGLGVQSPDTSLGLIVHDNYQQFLSRPWLFWGPFVVIVLISLAINFIGDGLRDAFDPRQTKVRA
ncbi:MAG: ABC transporter permease [Sciscionella sp.]|nr:ABC transporter permease [Sciscionella sp.]